MSVATLMRCLYGTRINETFRYADWDGDHPDGKAGFVLGEGAPDDWYWLEDPIPRGEQTVLVEKPENSIATFPSCPAPGIPRCCQ